MIALPEPDGSQGLTLPLPKRTKIVKNASIPSCAIVVGLLAGCADQTPAPRTQGSTAAPAASAAAAGVPIIRWAHADQRAIVDRYFSVDPTCTSNGYPEVRVIERPAHGTVVSARGRYFPSFPKDNVRWDCNRSLADSTSVTYQSAKDFQGKDEFTIEARFPDSSLKVAHYILLVDVQSGLSPGPATRRGVHSGEKNRLDTYFSLSPACDTLGSAEIVVVRAPGHGSITTETGMDYPNYGKDIVQSDCNRRLVPSTRVFCQSAADFHGEDSAELEVRWPTHFLKRVAYAIEVLPAEESSPDRPSPDKQQP